MQKEIIFFDTEIIGKDNPVFVICVKNKTTGKRKAFLWHRPGDQKRFIKMLTNPNYTWVGFNSANFDQPIVAAAVEGYAEVDLKTMAGYIIDDQMRSWEFYKQFNVDFLKYDHVDLYDVAPGVKVSLKTYAGRMGFPTMQDMPFAHDVDLRDDQIPDVVKYCHNDVAVTEALYDELIEQIKIRMVMSEEQGIDLRSKSDAQIAEAILKKACGIPKKEHQSPAHVTYTTPDFIVSDSPDIHQLKALVDNERFKIDFANGNVIPAEWMKQPLKLGFGSYQVGVGGLHSTHDQQLYLEASENLYLSDFDVASYYPNIMMKAGLIPKLGGNRGQIFIDTYRGIYENRIAAKRAGDKKTANTLKIVLNGTFGKLGSIYCAFYSPDLMLAVTLTGQLNLLCLIYDLEKIKGAQVRSANTDGVLVAYPPKVRDRVLQVFKRNSKRTGFEYEETPYWKYAAKDVNNYLAITDEREVAIIAPNSIKFELAKRGKVKRKGLYGVSGISDPDTPGGKNPTMEVCSNMAIEYLKTGVIDISQHKDMRDFVSVRNVKGGGIQYDRYIEVDDWVLTQDNGNASNVWVNGRGKEVKRKSRPKPYEVGQGGEPFGRVARWYMTTKELPPLSYIDSGNRVPKTEGARLCLTLPKELPKDLDKQWYIDETQRILVDLGVTL